MSEEFASREGWNRLRSRAMSRRWLDQDEERELLGRAQAGDRAAKGELIDSHMRMVVQIAARYESDGLSIHDLVSEGVVGLIEAIDRFELSHPTRLSTYAAWWVKARVREYAFSNRRSVCLPSTRGARVARARLSLTQRRLGQQLGREATRAELAEALGISDADVASVATALSSYDLSVGACREGTEFEPSDERPSPEQEFARLESARVLSRAVETALDHLPERDRQIVREQFFADEQKNMAQLGNELGISRQRVCQIFARLRKQLGRELSSVAC